MKIEANESTNPTPPHLPEVSQHAGFSRRALLRAGAGASPILLTLTSGPVAANGLGVNGCVLASSFVSVATFKSRNPTTTTLNCAAQKVEYWVTQAQLPPPNPLPVPPTGLDVTVATLLGGAGSTYDTQTVRSVLLAQGGAVATVGELGTLQHLLAMALNLNSGNMTAGGGFDLTYIQTIWSNYKSNGNRYKVPASGIDWGDAEIIPWARLLLGYSLLP
jgi:hypothetical protein